MRWRRRGSPQCCPAVGGAARPRCASRHSPSGAILNLCAPSSSFICLTLPPLQHSFLRTSVVEMKVPDKRARKNDLSLSSFRPFRLTTAWDHRVQGSNQHSLMAQRSPTRSQTGQSWQRRPGKQSPLTVSCPPPVHPHGTGDLHAGDSCDVKDHHRHRVHLELDSTMRRVASLSASRAPWPIRTCWSCVQRRLPFTM
ncbi:hypothetical protein E2C01_035213 [Portunus trituberculatus]|uniref:Uncharacterized protein n=1 Tax=Portunus trituberculatus TaxID=210409 RepID=A0A5B7F3L4_PORTR|nr:hypothetical protein [Portunus trituberculatus]